MNENIIRSIIFLVVGLVMIIFTDQVYNFQVFVIKKLNLKLKLKKDKKSYLYTGVAFIIVATCYYLITVY